MKGHAEWVRWLSPSDDGKLLISASNDQTARTWDPMTGESRNELRGHEHVVEVAVFAPVTAYPALFELASMAAVCH